MKRVQSITKNAAVRVMDGSAPMPVITAPLGTVDDQTGEVVEKLFRQLQAIFPAHKQAWPDDKALDLARRSWTKGFMAAGICTIEHIRYGIEQCRLSGSPFAPSVGQFIKWCLPTPEMLNIPSHDKAFREALLNLHPSRATTRVWSHPAVRHAALQCETHNLVELTSDKASEIFDRAYDITIRMLVNGLPLENIAIGIGHDGQKSEVELADEHASRFQARVMEYQGIPTDGPSARTALLAKLNIRREGHA